MCPSCKGMISVPHASQPDAKEDEELVSVRKFSEQELAFIRREGLGAYDAYIGSAVKKYWQFALLADLLQKRMQPLQDTILDIMRPQAQWEEETIIHNNCIDYLNKKMQDFFSILFQLNDRFVQDLDRVLYQDDLQVIIGFANQVGANMMRMKKFHEAIYETPLPGVYPYPELLSIMKGWAPAIWQTMNNVCSELKTLSVRKEDDSAWRSLQFCFSPPSMHEFFYHKMGLPEYTKGLLED